MDKTYKQICFNIANITLGNCPTEVFEGENKLLQKLSQHLAKISKPSSAKLCQMTPYSRLFHLTIVFLRHLDRAALVSCKSGLEVYQAASVQPSCCNHLAHPFTYCGKTELPPLALVLFLFKYRSKLESITQTVTNLYLSHV